MTPFLVAPPAAPLIALTDAKAHLRVVGSDEDAYIAGLVAAATGYLDGWSGILGRCIQRQTWAFHLTAFEDTVLPFPDAGSVAVSYFDASGVAQTLPDSSFALADGLITFKVRPEIQIGSSVTVTADYGYAPGSEPTALRHAVLMLVASWHENREGQADTPPAVASAIAPFRARLL